MNVLPFEKKVRVVSALADGNSIRAAGRLCDAHRDTVMYLGVQVGEACRRLHDLLFVDLQVDALEFDEIWGFIQKKERRVKPTDPDEFGDTYTFIALDASRKAIVSFLIGKRTADSTDAFAKDVRKRIISRPQITTDGYQPYPSAVAAAFGYEVDYSQIIKEYGNPDSERDDVRYSRSKCIRSQKIPLIGAPDDDKISTSYVERQNLSMRLFVRRQTRLTNGFSRKLRHHVAAICLYVAHYNLCRIHKTLRTSPAVALGVTDHVWGVPELMDAALSIAPAPEPPNITAISLSQPQDRQLDLFDRPHSQPELPPGFQLSLFHD